MAQALEISCRLSQLRFRRLRGQHLETGAIDYWNRDLLTVGENRALRAVSVACTDRPYVIYTPYMVSRSKG